jgi:phosphoserine phosphatase RsbU/P
LAATSVLSLVKKEKTFFVIPNRDVLKDIFLLILREAVRSIGAKNGNFFFLNEEGILTYLESTSNIEITKEIAKHSFENKTNLLLKKGQIWNGNELPESYMSCYLGEESVGIGVFLLQGIQGFENFSTSDFDTFSVYSNTLSLLLKESCSVVGEEEIFLKFSTSILLLLHSTDNYQKKNRLEYLLKEVIRVSGLINSSNHLNSLLMEVMESVKSVFKTESCSILLVDKEKNDLYFHLIAGEKEEEISKIRVPLGKGIAGTVALSKEPMIINDAQNDDRVYKVVDKSTGFVTRNILAAPLVVGEEVIGVIEAINTIDRNNFNETDIDLFLSFSDASALAIQKTRLLEDLEKTNKNLEKTIGELGSLYELGLAVNESKDDEELFSRCIKIISNELNSSITAIYIVDQQTNILKVRYLKNNKYESFKENFLTDSIIVDAIIQNKTKFKSAYSSDIGDDSLDSRYLEGPYVIIPMIFSNGKPFGAISVSSGFDKPSYSQSQLRLLLTITSQFIKGYENIKLNQDMIAKKAIEKEIEITRNIQKNILPPKILGGSNFEMGVKSVPAKEVSGDFYDFYQYEDGQYSFLIADVSGKSLPAAIFMAMSSSIIRTISRDHTLSPAELLEESNSLIFEDSESGMFVTLFYIHYNPSTSIIDFASAGHNDQIWIKADGSYEILKGKGAPLGVIRNTKYTGGKIKPTTGDMIVLYTDGAIEQENDAGEEYGLERFISEIISRKDKNSQVIIDEIYDSIKSYSQSQDQFDDFTVLIIKFNDDFQFRKKFQSNNSNIPKLREFVFGAIEVRNLKETDYEDILLCCDEAATNIVMHSYKDTELKNPMFECLIKFTEDSIQILLKDQGKKFEREKVPKPSLEANLRGERKGGFGVYLIEKLMNKVEYRYINGVNEIFMEKKI